MKLSVENIKCGGCASTISKQLRTVFNTDAINVNVEQGIIDIDIDETKRAEVLGVLLNLGYPQANTVSGLRAAKAKAKSFVSCAVGKMDL